MDENILHQVCGVLDKYGKNYSEAGVLANLKSWVSNKGWLVELLRRHPNWSEEALAVIHEVTHSREIDRSTVNYHKYELMQLMDALDLSNDDRIKLHGALDTITGAYSKMLPDAEIAIRVKEYSGVSCSAGQKSSRIINAICKKYGLDQHPEYNAKFAQLADSLNPLQVQRTALLSVHPCDYLEMSNRDNSWNSCHCLEGGEYHAGTLSYMNDACSMIFYTVDDGVSESFHAFPKLACDVDSPYGYGAQETRKNDLLFQRRPYHDVSRRNRRR